NAKYLDQNKFTTYSCFVGGNVRKLINDSSKANYIPVFLSEIYQLLEHGERKIDVALLKVSPPDQHGYCSLGVSVDVSLAAIRSAKRIVVEVNENVPRVHGDGFIHISQIDKALETHDAMYAVEPHQLSKEEIQIGKCIAGLIEDGSTLQMGIGGIPDAVLAQLGGHKDLGIHTEMFSDGVLPLVEKGVVTGKYKKVLPGKLVSCFSLGSKKLYDFLDDNPIVEFKEASFTNDTALIRKNPKVVAVNSAIEVDLTGQVCADSIGTYQYSGVGGQMDFIRGASLTPGGKPIIAMTSATKKGVSKISPLLKPGASVTTTRAHVRWIVTEYGAVNLFGKDLLARAKALISIAHPDHREELEKAMKQRFSA
ncbi:MAG: acetyl-CoA hydrolase/transferase C-terminal domain-containing protein, partial [Bacteroidota bacterium]